MDTFFSYDINGLIGKTAMVFSVGYDGVSTPMYTSEIVRAEPDCLYFQNGKYLTVKELELINFALEIIN